MRLRIVLIAALLVSSCGDDDGTKPAKPDGSLSPVGDSSTTTPDGGVVDAAQSDVPTVIPDGGSSSTMEAGSGSSAVLERPPGALPRPPITGGLPAELKPPR
jgi:hypothetical protein